MVDTKNENALGLVGNFIACPALWAIPPGNVLATANAREGWDLALG